VLGAPALHEHRTNRTLEHPVGPQMGRKKLAEARKCHLSIAVKSDVTLKNPHGAEKPYIGKVVGIEKCTSTQDIFLKLQWYYHPEESNCGRQTFHGAKELFLSDHTDEQRLETVEGVVQVHSLKDYEELSCISASDYFWRYNYKASTGAFTPKSVPVFCSCEEPYNPDIPMIECERCHEWFHLSCVGLETEDVDSISTYLCFQCDPGSAKRQKIEDTI